MSHKVLISGKDGQLLTDIKEKLSSTFFNVYAFSSKGFDVTNDKVTKELFNDIKPDIYIHGASYHSVDQIENNPTKALDVNVASLHRISNLCNKHNTTLINFSTDYVFSGNDVQFPQDYSSTSGFTCTGPYVSSGHGYNERWQPNPVNFYGISKYAGEMTVANTCENFMNVRVCGLFGKTGSRAKKGMNFPLMVLDKIDNNEEMNVVNDQYITVGYTKDIAENLVELMKNTHHKTTFHLMNEGILTWYDLASFIAQVFEKEYLIKPCSSTENYSSVGRPKYSALQNNNADKLPRWESAIVRFLKEIKRL